MNISFFEKFKKVTSVTLIGFIVFSTLTPAAFAAVTLTNGNFDDITGMVDIGGGWYDGIPNGWSTTGTNQYVINNNVLNLDHVGTFSQTLSPVEVGAENVTVSFEYGDIWNGGYYAASQPMITVELVNTTTSTTVTKVVTNDVAFGSMKSESISMTAAANDVLEIQFTALPGTGGSAAALDNVAVTAIDSIAPTITNISSDKANGTYTIGEIIDLDVTFSENVSGTMTLTLDSGGTCDINIVSSTVATCDYTVGATQNSSDLTLASATGAVTDAAGNPMTNFVPTVNLAANKALIISTPVPPTLTEVTPVTTPTFDTTPTYVFHSTEAGDITYSGGCTSSTTVAVVGNNTVNFDSLAVGTHNCTITVTDIDMEFRNLPVTQFIINPVVPNTVVVNSLNTGSWGHIQEAATGTGAYALTPIAPPLGSGAFQMDINASGGYYLGAPLYSNTRLADITELSYSTYRSSTDAGNNLAIALQLNVDYDATDATSTWQGRLVYEPYNTPGIGGTIMQDTWYNWDGLSGRWWMTGNAIVGNMNVGKACTQWTPCNWSDLLIAYPNAAISSAVGFKAGSNWGAAGFSGFVDNFNIAIKDTGIDTTYNFEFDTTTPSAGEITPVPAITNDESPEYTFTTDEAGTITYGGSCAGSTATATVGNNVINFNTLVDGNYADCTITVTDIASNQITFPVSPFIVDTVAPTVTSVSITSNNAVSTVAKESNTITLSFTTTENIWTPTVSIAGNAATVSGGSQSWTATHTVLTWDTNGTVTFTINATDTAGNSMVTVTGVTDTSSVSIDTEKVLINGLKVVPTHTAVSLDFTTTENAKSTLLYGLTNAYGFISEIATMLTSNHVASVGGLMACTTYQFALRVTDIAGNEFITSNDSFLTNCNAPGSNGGGVGVGPQVVSPITVVPVNPSVPTTPTQPTTPANNPTPETPNTTPETWAPEVTPSPETPINETPENTPAPNPTTPTQPTIPTGNTTGGGTGGTTGGNAGPGFNPADATLDIGGAGTSDEGTTAEEVAPTPDATLDAGGWVAVEDSSYTLLWTLLGLIALLNTWWFFVAKNKPDVIRRD